VDETAVIPPIAFSPPHPASPPPVNVLPFLPDAPSPPPVHVTPARQLETLGRKRKRPPVHRSRIIEDSSSDDGNSPEEQVSASEREEEEVEFGDIEGSTAQQLRRAQVVIARLRGEVRDLRREKLEHLEQLTYLADSVHTLGEAAALPPSDADSAVRKRFVAKGFWPDNLHHVETMSFSEIGKRLGDYYRGCSKYVPKP